MTSHFEQKLVSIINGHCIENESDTPDHLLAEYIRGCLDIYNKTVKKRDEWHGFKPWSGNASTGNTRAEKET